MSLVIIGLVLIGIVISFFWLKKINRNISRTIDASNQARTGTTTKTRTKPAPPCKRNPDEDNEF